MKIEKLDDNKIKVTITIHDLEERNIDLNSLNYNSPATQELFWDMMEQAESKFGFSASNSQLCVEASTHSEDGFIITITKVEQNDDFESIHKYIKNKFKKTDLRVRRKSTKIYSPIMIYSFNNFDDLCALSSRIQSIYLGDSTLYKFKDLYYLIISKNTWDDNSKILENIINDYGDKISNISFYEGYLNEYGTKIAEYNALEIIENYFKN